MFHIVLKTLFRELARLVAKSGLKITTASGNFITREYV